MFINSYGEDIITDEIYRNDILEINLAGITNPNPNYKMVQNASPSRMTYRYYVFEYVLEGRGYIETPEKTYTVSAGDMYFLNKGKYHIYYPDPKDLFKKEFIVLRGILSDKLASLYRVEDSVIIRHENVHPLFEKIFTNLQREEIIPNDELELLVVQLFQLIRAPSTIAPKGKNLAERIKDYLYDHVQEKLNVARLSHEMNISESVAYHTFSEYYGSSLMKYYMSIKMDYAKQLLGQTDDTVVAIAHRLSFQDEKYFSRCFKKEFGITPSQYRKSPGLDWTREYKE